MFQVLIALILLGLLLYVVGLLPIDGTIKQVIKAVAIVLVLVWVLSLLWPMLPVWPTFHR